MLLLCFFVHLLTGLCKTYSTDFTNFGGNVARKNPLVNVNVKVNLYSPLSLKSL